LPRLLDLEAQVPESDLPGPHFESDILSVSV